MTRIFALAVFLSVATAGCTGSGYMTTRATVVADTGAPDLVYVSPGVRVIADYDEPIFYADGYYWRYYDDTWFRSAYYTGGWVYVDQPPVVIARIDRPYRYERYRPQGYVVHRRPVPAHRLQPPPRVHTRDHRVDRDVPAYQDRGHHDRGQHRGHRR
jgi:hypothetical protein